MIRLYAPPRDRLRLETNDGRIASLVDRLWNRADDFAPPALALEPHEISLHFVTRPGPGGGPLPEREVAWNLGEEEYELRIGAGFRARIDLGGARIEGDVADRLLDEAPELVARYLEAASAVLFGRRTHTVLHAGAIVGKKGAVVVRGPGGAGKSTLVAAGWRAGFRVLGDESLLVSVHDSDELASSVRDLTLLPPSVELLALPGTVAAFSGGEEKRRVDLFRSSSPADRKARRAAAVLLGPREPGPARLATLSSSEFREEFARGAIPQERIAGDPDRVALDWSASNAFRLDGAVDLPGAVEILRRLGGDPVERAE